MVENAKLVPKLIPFLSKKGSMRKKDNDGRTSQNTLFESSETFSVLPVSIYNHIIPRKETSGNEARIPPQSELRLDISDTATTNPAVSRTLRR